MAAVMLTQSHWFTSGARQINSILVVILPYAVCACAPQDLEAFPKVDLAQLRLAVPRLLEKSSATSVLHYVIKDNKLFRRAYGPFPAFSYFADMAFHQLAAKVKLPGERVDRRSAWLGCRAGGWLDSLNLALGGLSAIILTNSRLTLLRVSNWLFRFVQACRCLAPAIESLGCVSLFLAHGWLPGWHCCS